MVDRNEWGAVSRCYNGLMIGPQGRIATGLADFLVEGPLSRWMARFGPEIFFHLRNRAARRRPRSG